MLEGKTILVGREDSQESRLLLLFEHQGKSNLVAMSKNVSNGVSRCYPDKKRAHCKLDVLSNDRVRVTNLIHENKTFVEGESIEESVVVDKNTMLELGGSRYPVYVDKVLEAVKKTIESIPKPQMPELPGTVSVDHLEAVWNNYVKIIEDIKRRQIRRGKQRLIPLVITSLGALSSFLLGKDNDIVLAISVVVMVVPLIFWIMILLEKDTSIEDTNKAEDKLIDEYKCPNPNCNHYLGKQSYKVIRLHGSCPYCKVKWNK